MNATALRKINIAEDFTRFPAGRFRSDGPFSGQRFREECLQPALEDSEVIEVELDGAAGFGSSFLDEAFGGLVRGNILKSTEVSKRMKLHASDESLITEILSYMK